MASVPGNISVVPLAAPPVKVFRPQSPFVALGLAVNHLMTKPAFANRRFGDWSRILVARSIASTTASRPTARTRSRDSWAGP